MQHITLSPEAKALMRNAGLLNLSDAKGLKPVRLARDMGMSVEKVISILEEINAAMTEPTAPVPTALSLMNDGTKQLNYIVTYSKAIDKMMQGGVSVGQLTEFCGLPGVGKTQLCMQLAIDTTIPAVFGGIEGEVVYIDSEGSLSIERLSEIANGVLVNLGLVASSPNGNSSLRENQRNALNQLGGLDSLLGKIYYWRVYDCVELMACVKRLHEFLCTHPKVKLIIVDSVAFHFRQDLSDMGTRNRVLNELGQTLHRTHMDFSVGVVVTNQMTTSFSNGETFHIPALGEAWAHMVTCRVLVSRTNDASLVAKRTRSDANITSTVRLARIVKSHILPNSEAKFIITKKGVRDCK